MKSKGFSLLEVLISVAIVSIASAMLAYTTRQFVNYIDKVEHYKTLYVKALSIRDAFASKEKKHADDTAFKIQILYEDTVNVYKREESRRGGYSFRVRLSKITIDVLNKKLHFLMTSYEQERD